ncbi:MAG TPA: hypothetical protein VEG63_08410 [Candidatus Acidoferrales bacterium]|nr:hypothetical protein [Candidatus Acidoferrales bacterium]
MKRVVLSLLVLTLAGCNSHKNDWVLQSYDKEKGYIFEHDGVMYQTRCYATGRPMLEANKPDLDPGALPPNIAVYQNECEDVLPYLHKPVPSFTHPYGSILLYTGKDNYRLEFEIKEAK